MFDCHCIFDQVGSVQQFSVRCPLPWLCWYGWVCRSRSQCWQSSVWQGPGPEIGADCLEVCCPNNKRSKVGVECSLVYSNLSNRIWWSEIGFCSRSSSYLNQLVYISMHVQKSILFKIIKYFQHLSFVTYLRFLFWNSFCRHVYLFIVCT